jgi:hypothetical protein
MTPNNVMRALSDEEWKAGVKRIAAPNAMIGLTYEGSVAPRLFMAASSHPGIVPTPLLHAAVALANDALPDEHPGKLTVDDLRALELRDHDGLDRVVEKLAALLRPDWI